MADVEQITAKQKNNGFTQTIATEKHERIARRSLHDIIIFHQAVEKEMQNMIAEKAKGGMFDTDLYDRMIAIHEQYKRVMTGFLELDDNSQRNALITFSDTIQDMMKYVHLRRKA